MERAYAFLWFCFIVLALMWVAEWCWNLISPLDEDDEK